MARLGLWLGWKFGSDGEYEDVGGGVGVARRESVDWRLGMEC